MKKIIAIAIVTVLCGVNLFAQEISVNAGATYVDNNIHPIIGVSFEMPFGNVFSAGVTASGLMRAYTPEMESAGKKYFSMRAAAQAKVRMLYIGNGNLSVLLGAGAEYSKEDCSNGEYIYRNGFTPYGACGLEYKFYFKNDNAISVAATADLRSNSLPNPGLRVGGTLTVAYSFAL